MADASEEENIVRLVVVGEDGCGKTTLLHTYLHDEYPDGIKRTLSVTTYSPGKYSSAASKMDKIRRSAGDFEVLFEDTRNNVPDLISMFNESGCRGQKQIACLSFQ